LRTLYAGRFLGNTSLRFPYAFLPAIARGVGIPLETAGVVLGARELAGITGPWLARLVDRGTRRTSLAVAALVLGLGSIATAFGGLTGFTIGMILAGLAKVAYDVTTNAWIGDHVPYEQRGRTTGLVETSWAGAFLVGVPLTGLLIDGLGWRSPFLIIGGLLVFLALVIPGVVAPDRPVPAPRGSRHHLRPAAIALYTTLFLESLGTQMVFASYGAWFDEEFGLSVAAVGGVTLVFGLAEMSASTGSAALTDRLGKRRSMLLGLALVTPILACIGLASSQVWAMALLFLAFLGFEFALVSGLPLASELDPDARTRTVGLAYASMTGARAIGAAGGIALFARHGMGWAGLVGGAVTAAAIVVVVLFVEEPEAAGV
jgi:predicted MFS family arabinose efflux permease